MATTFLTFNPTGMRLSITASATTSHRKSDNNNHNHRQRSNPSPSPSHPQPSTSSKWWGPLFGWSSDADYIDDTVNTASSSLHQGGDPRPKPVGEEEKLSPATAVQTAQKSKFAPGCFTEEKAKRLRMMTKETETFHDIMYHSAIASRLASDFSDRCI